MSTRQDPSALDALIDENMALRAELAARDETTTEGSDTPVVEPDVENPTGVDGGIPEVGAPVSSGFGRVGLRFANSDENEQNGRAELGELDVATIVAERDTYLADSQRLAADFANYRKQSDKRVADTAAAQSAGLVRGLLPVLDACDSALEQDPESAAAPIRGALLAELERNGLELLAPASGETFDPEMHEAVMHEDGGDDGVGPVVDEVFRSGYVWKGKVVRPAMVKVVG
ncbi:MAG: nucleotide exchange factor GrpE [Acidimicrobiales bacterium]